ncbi:MAG: hypothetical protein ACRDFS_11070 [Chloroflexota bacterium]
MSQSSHAVRTFEIERHPMDLAVLAREVAELFQNAAREAGCELSVHLNPLEGNWDRAALDRC